MQSGPATTTSGGRRCGQRSYSMLMFVAVAVTWTWTSSAAAAEPPNILFILAVSWRCPIPYHPSVRTMTVPPPPPPHATAAGTAAVARDLADGKDGPSHCCHRMTSATATSRRTRARCSRAVGSSRRASRGWPPRASSSATRTRAFPCAHRREGR
eukprot:COSAG06_NODE_3604_length_5131_cov_1.935612_2_plen_155_part_00